MEHPVSFAGKVSGVHFLPAVPRVGEAASIGSVGDSYDNALAESVIGLFKTELVRHCGPWRGLDDLELATLEWVDWFNNTRLHSALGYCTPAEVENAWHHTITNTPDQPVRGQLTAH